MNRLHTSIAQAVALVAFASASGIAVAVTQNINVSASVASVCKMSGTSETTMAFGTMDPSAALPANKTATTNIVFKCTKNTGVPIVTVGGSLTGLTAGLVMTVSGNNLPYSVAWTAPTAPASGFGSTSTDTTVTLTGTVLATDYTAAPAGDYTATLAVIVAP